MIKPKGSFFEIRTERVLISGIEFASNPLALRFFWSRNYFSGQRERSIYQTEGKNDPAIDKKPTRSPGFGSSGSVEYMHKLLMFKNQHDWK